MALEAIYGIINKKLNVFIYTGATEASANDVETRLQGHFNSANATPTRFNNGPIHRHMREVGPTRDNFGIVKICEYDTDVVSRKEMENKYMELNKTHRSHGPHGKNYKRGG